MEAGSKNTLQLMIYQTEMERVKYLLRSYLRTRLYKVNITVWNEKKKKKKKQEKKD
jgi:hypothetical protein